MEKNTGKISDEKKIESNTGSEVVENKVIDSDEKKFELTKQKSSSGFNYRENPWMISTVVLVLILMGFIFFGGIGNGNNGGVTGNVVSGEVAAGNLISFIQKQSKTGEEDVSIVSNQQEGSMYKVVVNYMGQEVPVFVSLDGKYLITDPIPLDMQLPPPGTSADTPTNTPVNVEIGDSPFKGKEDAPVTIVEFSDYQCPYCGKFFTETLSLIDTNYIKTGKVKFVYKDFPLNFHENAQKAAEAARCVGEQKGDAGYFKMHDKLYQNQESLGVENLKKWARELGVDGAKFDKCLDDGKFADAVKIEMAYGQQLGVSGTPAFFINGKMLTGAQPYSAFQQVIDAELSAAGSQ